MEKTMSELLTPRPLGTTQAEQIENSAPMIAPIQEYVTGVNPNSRTIIEDPRLLTTAIVFHLETVENFHRSLGLPEDVAKTNRANRRPELTGVFHRLHGPNADSTNKQERKTAHRYFSTVLDSTKGIWSNLGEDIREQVVKNVEARVHEYPVFNATEQPANS